MYEHYGYGSPLAEMAAAGQQRMLAYHEDWQQRQRRARVARSLPRSRVTPGPTMTVLDLERWLDQERRTTC